MYSFCVSTGPELGQGTKLTSNGIQLILNEKNPLIYKCIMALSGLQLSYG